MVRSADPTSLAHRFRLQCRETLGEYAHSTCLESCEMTGYRELKSQGDIDTLVQEIAGFHDSLTKELRIINRASVRPDRSMVMGFKFDGQLVIQSQWPPFAIEFVLCNVLELHVKDPKENWSGGGKFLNIGLSVDTAIEFNFDGGLRVRAERIFHASRPDWLGHRAFLGPEIPSPDAVKATKLEGKWRQCSSCSDAWEEADTTRFALCPSCGVLTDLQ